MKQTHPDATVELWTEDEHRIGLKPILRRVWAKCGQRPIVTVHHRFQWLYVYGIVHPESGRSFLPLLPKVNIAIFNQALHDFGQQISAGNDHWIILLMDRAGWHRSKQVMLPTGIQIEWLPPYSPELQPAERLWPLTNEGVANQCFPELNALAETQRRRCEVLQATPDLVRAHTLFHWWPTRLNAH